MHYLFKYKNIILSSFFYMKMGEKNLHAFVIQGVENGGKKPKNFI
ncbi:hypothetical protein [Clostridium botulinum]